MKDGNEGGRKGEMVVEELDMFLRKAEAAGSGVSSWQVISSHSSYEQIRSEAHPIDGWH